MRCFFLLSFIFFINATCFSQEEGIVYSYKDIHATIANQLSTKKILLLGENNHKDGTTFTEKIKLISYLQKNMGIRTVVLESPMYYMIRAAQDCKNGETNNYQDCILKTKAIYSMWTQSKEFQPLLNLSYSDSINLLGFDCRYYQNKYNQELTDSLNAYFLLPKPIQQTLTTLLNYEYKSKRMIGKSAKEQFIEYVDNIIQKESNSSFWLQQLKSIKGSALSCWYQDKTSWWSINNHRDEYMAKNLKWIIDNMDPNEKVIVWAASIHISKELGATDDKRFENFKGMGDWLEEYYPHELLTIGFTAYQGGKNDLGQETIINSHQESIEASLKDSSLALVNLKKYKSEKIYANFLFLKSDDKYWTKHFDYLYFIKTMRPSTKINQSNKK